MAHLGPKHNCTNIVVKQRGVLNSSFDVCIFIFGHRSLHVKFHNHKESCYNRRVSDWRAMAICQRNSVTYWRSAVIVSYVPNVSLICCKSWYSLILIWMLTNIDAISIPSHTPTGLAFKLFVWNGQLLYIILYEFLSRYIHYLYSFIF